MAKKYIKGTNAVIKLPITKKKTGLFPNSTNYVELLRNKTPYKSIMPTIFYSFKKQHYN